MSKLLNNKLTRRNFLKTTGVVATSIRWQTAKSYAQTLGSNDRIQIGFIGAGYMGDSHLDAYKDLKTKNNLAAVAVVDCWKKRADAGASKIGASHAFTDYRDVLDLQEINYVVIATPEHQHVQMTLDALDAGKAIYCEKPLTHTIPEALAVMKKQQETKLPLQVGIQGMSDDSYVSAGHAIRDGVIGKVVQAQIAYTHSYEGHGLFCVPDLKDDMPQPSDLDWNSWLGPAPKTAWNPHHYFEWRNYSMYSGGIATDLFIHRLARIMRACDLKYPRRVVGMGGIWRESKNCDLPDNFEMICEYPRGMTVYVLGTQSNSVDFGHLIRGYRGTLYFTDTGWVAKNKDGEVLAEHQKKGSEDILLHHTNLQNHIRMNEPLNCPVELGVSSLVAVVMANESWRTGQMMAWDTNGQRMVAANSLKHNPYPE